MEHAELRTHIIMLRHLTNTRAKQILSPYIIVTIYGQYLIYTIKSRRLTHLFHGLKFPKMLKVEDK